MKQEQDEASANASAASYSAEIAAQFANHHQNFYAGRPVEADRTTLPSWQEEREREGAGGARPGADAQGNKKVMPHEMPEEG